MRNKIAVIVAILATFLSGCHLIAAPSTPTVSQVSTSSPTQTIRSTRTSPPPTLTPSPSPTESPPQFKVILHPDGGLYVGDLVSFEIIPLEEINLDQSTLSVSVEGQNIDLDELGNFGHYGIAGRYQATLPWAWDTSTTQAGEVPLTFNINPEGIAWEETVTLLPASEVSPPQPKARWAHEESDCCLFYTITDTASERDIESITQIVDLQAMSVTSQMNTQFSKPVVINLIPRTLGHGGFASDEIFVSYSDRNYAGQNLSTVVHHEMVHILDAQIGGDLRPTIFVEGLAVYLTGGHFKSEPLIPRAAALLDPSEQENGLGWYLPLIPLADDFYNSQHEIGYLEAGSIVEYMVETWGWEAFSAFYRDIHPDESGKQSAAIDKALQIHFGITFQQLEKDFITKLLAEDVDPKNTDDLQLSVAFYKTVRRYEQALDPSAYFLTAWLPDVKQMRERGIIADFLRHPSTAENIALETLLVSADTSLKSGDYTKAKRAIDAVGAVLNSMDEKLSTPFLVNSLANAHYQITQILLKEGYIAQTIEVEGMKATAQATTGWADLTEFSFAKQNGVWQGISH